MIQINMRISRTDARLIARAHMTKHGLLDQGWTFEFDRAKKRLGACKFRRKVISLSVYLLASNHGTFEEVTDTILHEIAHALVGSKHGHDAVWKAKAREIGAKPNRCGPSMEVKAKFALVCPWCQYRWPRHRRNKRATSYVCNRPNCTKKPKLVWVENR